MTWTTRRLGAVAEVMLGRQRSPEHEDGPHMVPYLRAANVKPGALELGDVKIMNFTPREQAIFALREGDVLITEGCGSLGQIGASAVVRASVASIFFQNTLLRARAFPNVEPRFLFWWTQYAFGSGLFASIASGANIYHLSAERVRSLLVSLPLPAEQQRIADFLDAETAKIDDLLTSKRRLVELFQERVDSQIRQRIAESSLVDPVGRTSTPLRRLLHKTGRPSTPGGEMITAYRDGQVTARSLRRAAGYTESWTETDALQGVHANDVVVHGLDGFAGAIGTSEVDGVCSPIYHVCEPRNGEDPLYMGRLLRLLAVTGYLGGFAVSTRERAYDFRNWGLFGAIPVPVVPHEEQQRIGGTIRKIAPLRAAVEASAALMDERRQALITAAVTGELDVATAKGAA